MEEKLSLKKELGVNITSEVSKYMNHQSYTARKPYTVFRGLKPSQSIVEISETVGSKMGIKM